MEGTKSCVKLTVLWFTFILLSQSRCKYFSRFKGKKVPATFKVSIPLLYKAVFTWQIMCIEFLLLIGVNSEIFRATVSNKNNYEL